MHSDSAAPMPTHSPDEIRDLRGVAGLIIPASDEYGVPGDDRVVRSLGLEPRQPFPKGHTLEQGDWSLLDPVRARPPMWRDVS